MNPRLLVRWARIVTLPAILVSCGGPTFPSEVLNEPVCPDYELMGKPMRGGLVHPIVAHVTRGKDPIAKVTLFGRRSDKHKGPPVLLRDTDETYAIEWSQCENPRAPVAREPEAARVDEPKYECGTETAFAKETLVTKKGDAASRSARVPAIPRPECWK